MEKFEYRVIVSGIGLSDTSRDSGRSGPDLALDAILSAIADAGLRADDIDGLASMSFGDRPPEEITDALGLEVGADGRIWIERRGAAGCDDRRQRWRLPPGLCRHVLIYRSVQRLGGLLGSASGALPPAEGPWEWHVPFHEYSAVNLMAMQARRHMHQYGTTKEQLGWIALTLPSPRRDERSGGLAGTNDHGRPYQRAPMISDPLGRLDCDLPIDGAVGLVAFHR